MNIFRPQRPYQFSPPRYSPVLAPFLMALSKFIYLRGQFKIHDMEIIGQHHVCDAIRAGHSVLIAPNHADHADPHVLVQAGRQCKKSFHFMAAREGFEQSPLNRWVLTRMGAFSVDREGADLGAIKQAITILAEAKRPLVIFPEGEIWHHHETLDEINEGVSSMLIKAYQRRKAAGDAVLIPTGIRYYYDADVEATFDARLTRLEQSINWRPRHQASSVDRIVRLCAGLLATKEVEFLGENLQGPLLDRLSHFQQLLVERVEKAMEIQSDADGLIPSRVKAARQKIRKHILRDEESNSELYDYLDDLYLAIQLYSYPGQYLLEEPSIDRIAETILKLEEDVLGKGEYLTTRRVRVEFGEPISMNSFLEPEDRSPKTAVGPLTELLSRRIQRLLDSAGTA